MWWTIASTALQAFSSYSAGQAQAADERQNEAIARHNAMLSEIDARALGVEQDENNLMNLFDRESQIASMLVSQGGRGARTDVGGPVRVRAWMGAMLDLKRHQAARRGQKAISDKKQEAAAFRAQAKQFGERAKNATKAGYFGAGTAILGGVASGVKQGYWGGGGSGGGSTSARTAGGSFGSTTRANYGNRLR